MKQPQSVNGDTPSSRTNVKTWAVVLLFVGLQSAGNSWMAVGMKEVPEKMSGAPSLYLHAMLNPIVAIAIAALVLAMLTRIALLSLADLSFVLPVTAIGYVLAVCIGKVFLHETISPQRWAGALLIFLGAVMVGLTRRNTTPEEGPQGGPPREDFINEDAA